METMERGCEPKEREPKWQSEPGGKKKLDRKRKCGRQGWKQRTSSVPRLAGQRGSLQLSLWVPWQERFSLW